MSLDRRTFSNALRSLVSRIKAYRETGGGRPWLLVAGAAAPALLRRRREQRGLRQRLVARRFRQGRRFRRSGHVLRSRRLRLIASSRGNVLVTPRRIGLVRRATGALGLAAALASLLLAGRPRMRALLARMLI